MATVELNTFAPAGELDRAESARQRMAALAERLGEPTMHWQVALNAGACMAMLRGDLPGLERCAEQGLELGSEAGEPDALMIYGGQLVSLRVLQGRAGEIVEMLEQGVKAYPLISAWKATLAWTLCWLDRPDEAAAIITERRQIASSTFRGSRAARAPWRHTRMPPPKPASPVRPRFCTS